MGHRLAIKLRNYIIVLLLDHLGKLVNELLMQPRSYTKTFRDRAFTVPALREWNLYPMKFKSITPS